MSLDTDVEDTKFSIPYEILNNILTIKHIEFPTGIIIKDNDIYTVEYSSSITDGGIMDIETNYVYEQCNDPPFILSNIYCREYNKYEFQLYFKIPISLCDFVYQYNKQYDSYKWLSYAYKNNMDFLHTQKDGLLQTKNFLNNSLYFNCMSSLTLSQLTDNYGNVSNWYRNSYNIIMNKYKPKYGSDTIYKYETHPSVCLINTQLQVSLKYTATDLELEYSFQNKKQNYSMSLTLNKNKLYEIGELYHKYNEKKFEEKQQKYNKVFTK